MGWRVGCRCGAVGGTCRVLGVGRVRRVGGARGVAYSTPKEEGVEDVVVVVDDRALARWRV